MKERNTNPKVASPLTESYYDICIHSDHTLHKMKGAEGRERKENREIEQSN